MHTHDSQPRALDQMLRGLRAHIRSRRLPRPERLLITTANRAAHLEFTTDGGPTRLGELLLWAVTLDSVAATWLAMPNEHLAVSLTGRGPGGITVTLTATAALAELYGDMRPSSSGLVAHLGAFRLPVDVRENVTVDELVRVVVRARSYAPTPPAVAA